MPTIWEVSSKDLVELTTSSKRSLVQDLYSVALGLTHWKEVTSTLLQLDIPRLLTKWGWTQLGSPFSLKSAPHQLTLPDEWASGFPQSRRTKVSQELASFGSLTQLLDSKHSMPCQSMAC